MNSILRKTILLLSYYTLRYRFIAVMVPAFIGLLLLSLLFSGNEFVYAFEEADKSENISKREIFLKNVDSCTERCHVNYMAYENKFKSPKKDEIFKHKTHSFEQNLDCISCHDNSEVNTKGHGKLIIKTENCLKCHHVELEEAECKRCHNNIDENPMKYKKEKFLHGFTVESDVDCGLCHINDPNASLIVEEINCVKCHHTTPFLDCIKCHENDINQSFNADLRRGKSLSWTVSFKHSQHQNQDLSCKECHEISHGDNAGVVEYNLNCSKCHHVSEEMIGCIECHKEPSEYLRGKIEVEGFAPAPDMMSRAVKCEDCHKYDDEGLKFKGVKEYCIECHNGDYGKLYNAWTKTIKDRLREFNYRVQSLGEDGNFLYKNWSNVEGDKEEEAGDQANLDTFIEKTGGIVNLITKYGTHNFNLTRILLDYNEDKTNDTIHFSKHNSQKKFITEGY